jgi:hypothetical protein
MGHFSRLRLEFVYQIQIGVYIYNALVYIYIYIYIYNHATHSTYFDQARIQTVAKVARATVRFFPPRIFRGSPLLDTGLNILRIFKKYILII